MNRRDALSVLAASGAALSPPLVACLEAQEASPEAMAWLLRTIAGVEPLPGEAGAVRNALLSFRVEIPSDPRVQPALDFNPEVEV
jgi:hypothetical protein